MNSSTEENVESIVILKRSRDQYYLHFDKKLKTNISLNINKHGSIF
jgi:hypothetical protein